MLKPCSFTSPWLFGLLEQLEIPPVGVTQAQSTISDTVTLVLQVYVWLDRSGAQLFRSFGVASRSSLLSDFWPSKAPLGCTYRSECGVAFVRTDETGWPSEKGEE